MSVLPTIFARASTGRSKREPRVLASVLACHKDLGSEASVAYRYLEILASRYRVTALATPPCTAPAGVRLVHCNAGVCQINDVDPLSLMRFELNQLRLAWLRGVGPFDLVHRITPAALSIPSLLPLLKRPLIVGPLIAAPVPPPSFDAVLRRPRISAATERLRPARILGSLARRASDYLDRVKFSVANATVILVGMQEARRQVPDQFRKHCVPLTWCGIEHQHFVPPARRPDGQPLKLLFVGRLVPYKGAELLLRAVGLARQRCRLELRIVGGADSDYGAFLGNLAAELGLGPSVRFEKPIARAELLQHYQTADVFCFPTLADTYGVSLLEAMACGCAAVASHTGGPAEILDEDRGIRIPLTDPRQYVHDFADALVELASNFDLRSRLGANARRYVVQEHDWDRIGRQLLEIYEVFTQRIEATNGT